MLYTSLFLLKPKLPVSSRSHETGPDTGRCHGRYQLLHQQSCLHSCYQCTLCTVCLGQDEWCHYQQRLLGIEHCKVGVRTRVGCKSPNRLDEMMQANTVVGFRENNRVYICIQYSSTLFLNIDRRVQPVNQSLMPTFVSQTNTSCCSRLSGIAAWR